MHIIVYKIGTLAFGDGLIDSQLSNVVTSGHEDPLGSHDQMIWD